jgi:HK97 family phage major capsid protein
MRRSVELLAQRAEKVKAAVALQDKAKAEKRDMSADEAGQVDAILAEADQIGEQAAAAQASELRHERIESAQASLSQLQPRPSMAATSGTESRQVDALPARAFTSSVRDLRTDDPTAGFRDIGELALAVAAGGRDSRLEPLAVMNQSQGAAGGFAVPKAHLTNIIDGLFKDELSLLNLCDRYPVEGESVDMPAMDETSRVDGSRNGGILGRWKGEQTQMTGTDSTLRQIKLEPQELYVYVRVTNKLLRNSSTLAAFINQKVAEEITFKVNDAIINGTGAGMPMGVLNSGALVSVTKKAGQAADTVIWENAKAIKGRVPPRSFARGVWLANQEVPEQLEASQAAIGAGGQLVYMPQGGISEKAFSTLYGRPMLVCEQCAALGDVGDLLFFDGGNYMIGWKGMVDQSFSAHIEFDYARTALRWILEMDGQPAITSAVTPYKGTKTLSSFVAIEAR